MRRSISDTAEYGDLTRGERVIGEESREAMKELLEEIKSGEFAREWINENKANRPQFTRLQEMDEEHEIEEVGRKLRGLITR